MGSTIEAGVMQERSRRGLQVHSEHFKNLMVETFVHATQIYLSLSAFTKAKVYTFIRTTNRFHAPR